MRCPVCTRILSEGFMKKIVCAVFCFLVFGCCVTTLNSMQKETRMDYARESLKTRFIIGVSLRTTNAEGKAFQDIPVFWKTVQENNLLQNVPAVVEPQKLYAVYTDYAPDGSYAMIIGKQVNSFDTVPAGMVSCVIPEGQYALFTAQGIEFAQAVGMMWGAIWQLPLDRAFTADFEVYDAALLSKPVPEVPIYVALKQ